MYLFQQISLFDRVGHILHKLKFLVKNRFTCDFTAIDKIIQNLIESDVQNYVNQKSLAVQPCISLEIILDGLYS